MEHKSQAEIAAEEYAVSIGCRLNADTQPMRNITTNVIKQFIAGWNAAHDALMPSFVIGDIEQLTDGRRITWGMENKVLSFHIQNEEVLKIDAGFVPIATSNGVMCKSTDEVYQRIIDFLKQPDEKSSH